MMGGQWARWLIDTAGVDSVAGDGATMGIVGGAGDGARRGGVSKAAPPKRYRPLGWRAARGAAAGRRPPWPLATAGPGAARSQARRTLALAAVPRGKTLTAWLASPRPAWPSGLVSQAQPAGEQGACKTRPRLWRSRCSGRLDHC